MDIMVFIFQIFEICVLSYIVYLFYFNNRKFVRLDVYMKCPHCGVKRVLTIKQNEITKCSFCNKSVKIDVDFCVVEIGK